MFGILNYDALIDQFGEEVAEELCLRFANLLLAKIKPQDCIARYSNERFVIVSNGVDLAQYSPQGPGERPSDRFRILMVEGSLMGGYEQGLEAAASPPLRH